MNSTAPVLPPPGSGECSACLIALAAQIPLDSVTRNVLAALDEPEREGDDTYE